LFTRAGKRGRDFPRIGHRRWSAVCRCPSRGGRNHGRCRFLLALGARLDTEALEAELAKVAQETRQGSAPRKRTRKNSRTSGQMRTPTS
jgi:hypothetical protein